MVGTLIPAASAASTPLFPSFCCYPSSFQQIKKFPALPFISSSQFINSSFSQLGWNGLKRLPTIKFSASFFKTKEKKRKLRGKVVHASLFGVGAPEALVIGVVALLVFGPKGLAEVARNLGKTLRAFQPTIRELQDVSREFKSTLEKEIGLDDISSSTNKTYSPPSFPNEIQQPVVNPNGPPKPEAYTSEDLLKISQEQLVVSSPGSQTQGSSSSPQEQKQDALTDSTSEVTTSTTPETATQSQIQLSEKTDKER